jgi:hypothetical protein
VAEVLRHPRAEAAISADGEDRQIDPVRHGNAIVFHVNGERARTGSKQGIRSGAP